MRKLLLGLIGLLFAIPAVADLDPCRNLFDSTPYKTGYYINESGVEQSANVEQYIIRQAVVQPGTQYTLSFVVTQAGYTQRYHAYDANDNWLSQVAAVGGSEVVGTKVIKTFTTPANTKYIRQGGRSQSEYQLELGSTATEYVPYCANPIKIATTKYNAARFSPVVTELNDTIATIRSVVTNTINQTKAIADLQATKQTRPNENCPAGKKCLLVEDNDGTPHWYEIIESASRLPDGFKELEYIESTGTQYIDTGYSNINAEENTYD
ncbi:MAG: hypothetical protein IKM94_03995, partial [Alphaproteobacteria bacterium]|nr:hypothetical protein [Alphaproteobacteria bacterium]